MKKYMWGGIFKEYLSEDIFEYTARTDVKGLKGVDYYLCMYEIYGDYAYTIMLIERNILGRDIGVKILNSLKKLEEIECDLNGYEDVHSFVEEHLLNDTGYTPHICRSRNDQIILLERLFIRDAVLKIGRDLSKLIEILVSLSWRYRDIIIPLYTHYRQADVSSLGHLFSSYAEMFLRDLSTLKEGYTYFNKSPIGVGAIATCTLPIDRKLLADLLCFDDLQLVSIDVITNRWEFMSRYFYILTIIMKHLSNIAKDLIFFSRDEVKAIILPENVLTGSSALPHKKNPDPLELMIGKSSKLNSYLNLAISLGGEESGYHREYQELKYALIDSTLDVIQSINIMNYIISNLKINKESFENMASKYLVLPELANYLAFKNNMSFREVHRALGKYLTIYNKVSPETLINYLRSYWKTLEVDSKFYEYFDIHKVVDMKKVDGGPGDINNILKNLKKSLLLREFFDKEYSHISECRENLRGIVDNVTHEE